jgi:hypothetical protein
MPADRALGFTVVRSIAMAIAAAVVTAASAAAVGQTSQTSTTFSGPSCTAPPATDGWPVAGTVTVGSTISVIPIVFTGASLLAADTGNAIRVSAVAATTANGGTVAGTDPYTYIARPTFSGTDVFTYEIVDATGERTVGLAKATVARDRTAPAVTITSPVAGAVSGLVTITASATDNVGVVAVSFFDGAAQIGGAATAPPFQTTWDTSTVSVGAHSLTAVARDAAGNTRTSAIVAVTVASATPH